MSQRQSKAPYHLRDELRNLEQRDILAGTYVNSIAELKTTIRLAFLPGHTLAKLRLTVIKYRSMFL